MPLQLITFNPSKKRKTKKARASAKKKRKARRMTAAQMKYFAPAAKKAAKQGGPTVAKKKKRRSGWFKKKAKGSRRTQSANTSTPPSGKRRGRRGGGGGRKFSIRQIGMATISGIGVGGVQVGLVEAQAWIIDKVWKPTTPLSPHVVSAMHAVTGVVGKIVADFAGFRKVGDLFLMGAMSAAVTNSYAAMRADSLGGLSGLGGLAFGPGMNPAGYVKGGLRISA